MPVKSKGDFTVHSWNNRLRNKSNCDRGTEQSTGTTTGPKVIKLFFSCSTWLSMKLSLLINVKMPTIVVIFIFISNQISYSAMFNKKKFKTVRLWDLLAGQISCSAELSMKMFYNLGTGVCWGEGAVRLVLLDRNRAFNSLSGKQKAEAS